MSYRLCNCVFHHWAKVCKLIFFFCGICRNFQWIRDLKAKIVSDASEHPAGKFLSFCMLKLLCLNAVCIVCTVPGFCLFVCCCFFFFGLTLLYSQDETFASTVNSGLAWLMFNLDPNTSLTASRDLTNSIFRWP